MPLCRLLWKQIAVILIALSIATGSAGYAQSIDFDALQEAANGGAAEAQLQLGEVLLFGNMGLPQDKDRGLELIARAATSEHTPAKARLGKILLDGYYVDADQEMGLRLLQNASAKGNVLADETLGKALLWGLGTQVDPVGAQSYLKSATDKGSAEAMRILGEQLIIGQIIDQDQSAGVSLLERGVAIGDAKAAVALGILLFYGGSLPQDRVRAKELFEAAADLGNGEGLYHLGADQMWSQSDPATAEALLVRSGELGASEAWATLAEGAMFGYLGKDRRQKFENFAEKARLSGETRVAVFDAQRRLYGISMRASGNEAIATLEQSAADGNADAAKFLIALVRDGNRLNVRKQPDRANTYLARFSDVISEADRERLTFTIKLSRTKQVKDFPGFVREFESRADLQTTEFGRDIFASNPNFAFYLLQTKFNEQGRNVGTPDGLAGKRTLKALWDACLTLPNTERCYDTIMHPSIISQLLVQ